MCLMIASNPAKAGFSSGTLKSKDILNIPGLWPSTNLEMIHIFIGRINPSLECNSPQRIFSPGYRSPQDLFSGKELCYIKKEEPAKWISTAKKL